MITGRLSNKVPELDVIVRGLPKPNGSISPAASFIFGQLLKTDGPYEKVSINYFPYKSNDPDGPKVLDYSIALRGISLVGIMARVHQNAKTRISGLAFHPPGTFETLCW